MEGRPEAAPLLALAERAEALGFDSVWVGDSLLARPRHDPLTLLAARGRAACRGSSSAPRCCCRRCAIPSLLAHQVATLDQVSRGARDPGRRHRRRRAQHPRRVRGRGRAVREARRPDARGHAAVPRAVDRQAGRLGRALDRSRAACWADAASPGRPADLGRRLAAGQPRARRPPFRRLVPERTATRSAGASSGARCRRSRAAPAAIPAR